MGRCAWLLVLGWACLSFSHTFAQDKKGTPVEFDGLKSLAPAEWKAEQPSNKLRYAQFRLPKAKDDKEDGDVVIFQGLGGSDKDNIERWKGQFAAPEGKKLDDIVKVSDMKIAGKDAVVVTINGTFKFKAAPFDPNSKVELKPNFRMVGVIFPGKDNVYHIKMTGPVKTVEQYEKGFTAWLKDVK